MERIWPKKELGMYINPTNDILIDECISEFGFYHWFGAKNGANNGITEEGFGDILIRSKVHDTNEGGVNTGYSFIDCVINTDE